VPSARRAERFGFPWMDLPLCISIFRWIYGDELKNSWVPLPRSFRFTLSGKMFPPFRFTPIQEGQASETKHLTVVPAAAAPFFWVFHTCLAPQGIQVYFLYMRTSSTAAPVPFSSREGLDFRKSGDGGDRFFSIPGLL